MTHILWMLEFCRGCLGRECGECGICHPSSVCLACVFACLLASWSSLEHRTLTRYHLRVRVVWGVGGGSTQFLCMAGCACPVGGCASGSQRPLHTLTTSWPPRRRAQAAAVRNHGAMRRGGHRHLRRRLRYSLSVDKSRTGMVVGRKNQTDEGIVHERWMRVLVQAARRVPLVVPLACAACL